MANCLGCDVDLEAGWELEFCEECFDDDGSVVQDDELGEDDFDEDEAEWWGD